MFLVSYVHVNLVRFVTFYISALEIPLLTYLLSDFSRLLLFLFQTYHYRLLCLSTVFMICFDLHLSRAVTSHC